MTTAEQQGKNYDYSMSLNDADSLIAITDHTNNVGTQIKKQDFVADIISTDSGNLIEVGTDNKLLGSIPASVIQGATEYGGTISTDLNSITKNGFYTAYGTSTGAPSSSYSWFVIHQNSNAGTASATQRAVAYNSTPIVYERVKTSSTWGAWQLMPTSLSSQVPIGTCSTASATTEKAVTLTGFILATGATILVSFDNANTSATITLNVNSTGAKNIYDAKGNQITGTFFNNATNEKCLFTYDGTNWILITAPFWESRMSSPSNTYVDLTLLASGNTYTAPADGYYLLEKASTATGQEVKLVIQSSGNTIELDGNLSTAASQNIMARIKAKKGDVIIILYSAAGSVINNRFVYTEGSKP